MSNNYFTYDKTDRVLLSFIICCTLSTCIATMNPLQAGSTYYSCICMAILLGMKVSPQPITGRSAWKAFALSIALSVVGMLLYLAVFGKKVWWNDDDEIAGKIIQNEKNKPIL